MSRVFSRSLLCLLCLHINLAVGTRQARGEDWPTYAHDTSRSGVTSESLPSELKELWTHRSPHRPRPAWPPPARQDFWHHHSGLEPSVTYDRAYHVVVSGSALCYGSSADDKVYCLDVDTGEERWAFFTEGPVRLAPSLSEGRVFAGSDDGCVYCLDLRDGSLIWMRRIAPSDRRIPGNGRMISAWPVRTGVLVDDGVAYCCAGLFPREGSFVCALRTTDGSILWRHRREDISPQGYFFASASRLFVPAGRGAPVSFSRGDGAHQGSLGIQGGAFALLAGEVVVSGPGRATGAVEVADATTRERIAGFQGLRLIVHQGRAYLQARDSLSAIDHVRHTALAREYNALEKEHKAATKHLEQTEREQPPGDVEGLTRKVAGLEAATKERLEAMQACTLWKTTSRHPCCLILAETTLIAGGMDEVQTLDAGDGTTGERLPVEGRAWGLAVSGGRLFVSTDKGVIHCFAAEGGAR